MFLDPVARLRRFNRAVVREAGALDTSFMGRGRPLGAARVLHLVKPEGTDVASIRATLGLDSGLMSRFLRALEREHLIETRTDPADRRRSIAHLTQAGLAEVAAYLTLIHDQSTDVLATAGMPMTEVLSTVVYDPKLIEFRRVGPGAAAISARATDGQVVLTIRRQGGTEAGESVLAMLFFHAKAKGDATVTVRRRLRPGAR